MTEPPFVLSTSGGSVVYTTAIPYSILQTSW